jgi:hypothetical protein
MFTIIFMMLAFIYAQTCPLKCPSCTRCDPKKGTCTLPRDFVSCTTKTNPALPGYCFAGVCNSKISLSPVVTSLKSCQTYSCIDNVCTLKNKVNGADCSVVGAALHSICLNGLCRQVILGVTDTFPMQNIGCVGVPNGTPCDTNDILNDGEACLNNVCKFPDGSFYGYVPEPIPVV